MSISCFCFVMFIVFHLSLKCFHDEPRMQVIFFLKLGIAMLVNCFPFPHFDWTSPAVGWVNRVTLTSLIYQFFTEKRDGSSATFDFLGTRAIHAFQAMSHSKSAQASRNGRAFTLVAWQEIKHSLTAPLSVWITTLRCFKVFLQTCIANKNFKKRAFKNRGLTFGRWSHQAVGPECPCSDVGVRRHPSTSSTEPSPLLLPVVPHKAVAEVSNIGNL